MARFRRAGFAGVVLCFLGARADFVRLLVLSCGAAGALTCAAATLAAAAGLTARVVRARGFASGDSAALFPAVFFRGLVFFSGFIGQFGFETGVRTVNQP